MSRGNLVVGDETSEAIFKQDGYSSSAHTTDTTLSVGMDVQGVAVNDSGVIWTNGSVSADYGAYLGDGWSTTVVEQIKDADTTADPRFRGACWDGTYLYCCNSALDVVYRFTGWGAGGAPDPLNGTLDVSGAGGLPDGVLVYEGDVYVLDRTADIVRHYDGFSTTLKSADWDVSGIGGNITGLDANEDGEILLANDSGNELLVYDGFDGALSGGPYTSPSATPQSITDDLFRGAFVPPLPSEGSAAELTIIPGYDFGTNEVPQRETLLAQARKMKITGISISEIDGTLIGYKTGTASGTTQATLPAPGWLWADPAGSLWVETDNGPCMLHRAGGGYETIRYGKSLNSADSGFPVPMGSPWHSDPNAAASAQTEGYGRETWRQDWQDSGGGAGVRNLFINPCTVVSSDSFPRLVGRGLVPVAISGTLSPQDVCMRRPGVGRVLSTAQEWVFPFASPESNIVSAQQRELFFLTSIAPDSGTSFFTQASQITLKGYLWGWKYDQAAHGPGTLI